MELSISVTSTDHLMRALGSYMSFILPAAVIGAIAYIYINRNK